MTLLILINNSCFADIVKISQELKVSTNLYFRSNGSPIIDITIKVFFSSKQL